MHQQSSGTPTCELAPWERRRGESAVAHQAFVLYRDLGPGRSLQQVAQARGCQVSLLKRWSSEYDWVSRARAWDAEQAQERERLRREQRRKALEQQAQDAELLRKLCRAFLQGLVQRDPDTGELKLDPRLKASDMASFYRLAQEIDESLPQPPQPAPEHNGDEALSELSTAELREMIEIARQQAQGGEGDGDADGQE